jgi:hypothetical protein
MTSSSPIQSTAPAAFSTTAYMAAHRQWPLTAIQHDLSTLFEQLHNDMLALVHSDYADFIRLSIHVGGVREQLEPWQSELVQVEQVLSVRSRHGPWVTA